ncbi:glycosyltransferase family 4 protein [Paraclostridium bifermentans]|uniref:glycosyltransferase family 4 protein n=1 Tax=Paraclostridium bifermentans TaxID=1490 RepID=UPI003D2B9F17
MKIVYIRSNPINPDPRVEKEMSAAINYGHIPIALGWNRSSSNNTIKKEQLRLSNGLVDIYRINIKSKFGSGVKNIMPLVKWQIALAKWLLKNRNKYDIIHACDFDTVLPALIMKICFNKKYVYDIFDFYVDAFSVPHKLKNVIKKLDFLAIKSAEATIIVNESRKEQIQGSKPKKLVVIHNTPIEQKNYINQYKGNKKTIFYGGILTENRMIKEAISICERHPEWNLIIAGFGPLESMCKKKGEEVKNIQFLGKIPYKEIIKYTMESDILFACYDPNIPNHKFSSPNKLYEAMMCKKPIIVCENTGIDKIVIRENIGLVCKFSEISLEQSFSCLLENMEQCKLMSENSFNLYKNNYSWNIMEKRIGEMYKNIN